MEQEQKPKEEGWGYGDYEYGENPFEDMDRDLCRKCHRRKIDKSENPLSVLCKECREEYIRLRVPGTIKVIGIVTLAAVLLCFVMFGADIVRFRRMSLEEFISQNGSRSEDDYAFMAHSGMVVTALDSMVEKLEETPDDIKMAIMLADIAMEYSYPDYAAYAIDNFLQDQYVSDRDYNKINGYVEELNRYYDTVDMADACWDKAYATYGESGPEEADAEALYREYHNLLEEGLGDDSYDQALLHYDLYYACLDEEEQVRHLEECISLNPCIFDAQAQLAVYYRSRGEFDKAREILEKTYETNHEDYAVLRAFATLELAEGNLEQGLSYAQSAYDIYPEGTYVADTYLIALKANGRDEEAGELIRYWSGEQGYVFDDDFYGFQSGEITLKEYYTKD